MVSRVLMTIALILGMMSLAYASTAADVKKGNLLYNNKKYEEAIKPLKIAMSLSKDFYPPRVSLGFCYFKMKRYDDAATMFKKALKLL